MTTSCRRPSPEKTDMGNTHGETGSTFPSPTAVFKCLLSPWTRKAKSCGLWTVTGEAAGLLCYYHRLP